jgi:hypothetical protein
MTSPRTIHPLYGAAPPGAAEARSWIGSRATDSLGVGIGRVEDVWADAATGEPTWILVREGRFAGGRLKLIPFDGATAGGGHVYVPYERDLIRRSPELDGGDVLTPRLEARLRRHYALAV